MLDETTNNRLLRLLMVRTTVCRGIGCGCRVYPITVYWSPLNCDTCLNPSINNLIMANLISLPGLTPAMGVLDSTKATRFVRLSIVRTTLEFGIFSSCLLRAFNAYSLLFFFRHSHASRYSRQDVGEIDKYTTYTTDGYHRCSRCLETAELCFKGIRASFLNRK